MDASRSGLLLSCKEPHAEGVLLWVTFPYDASTPDSQPEIPARVARSRAQEFRHAPPNGKNPPPSIESDAKLGETKPVHELLNEPKRHAVAVYFEEQPHEFSNGNHYGKESERRRSPRHPLAVPVRLRLEHMPWFEEAMTVDVSGEGMKLRSSREYEPGTHLLASFGPAAYSPWPSHSEIRAMVLRVDRLPETSMLSIAVCRLQ